MCTFSSLMKINRDDDIYQKIKEGEIGIVTKVIIRVEECQYFKISKCGY